MDSDKETICRKADGYVPDVMATIIILNYLAYAQPLLEGANFEVHDVRVV